MIFCIAGKRNSGKTSCLNDIYKTIISKENLIGDNCAFGANPIIEQIRSWFHNFNNPAGFLSVKNFNRHKFQGYDIYNLRQNTNSPFIRFSPHELYDFSLGPFYFFSSGFKVAEKIYSDSLRIMSDIFFIDEIGRLELTGNGFAGLFLKIIDSFDNVIFTSRDSYINGIVATFNLKKLKVININ